MAFRVRNGSDLLFGLITASGGASAVAVRFRKGSDDSNPVIKALGSTLTVTQNSQFRIPEHMLSVTYPTGDLTDGHMEAAVKPYWDGVAFEIDMMSAMSSKTAGTPVAAAGYAQQSTNDWDFDTPAD